MSMRTMIGSQFGSALQQFPRQPELHGQPIARPARWEIATRGIATVGNRVPAASVLLSVVTLLIATVLAASMALVSEAATPSPRPNILWLSCEDIGPHLGCYGYLEATTPNLDQLARQGTRYANASTVTGVCATCRASMITAMYPSTLGNQFMRCSVDLPASVPLFPQYFRDAGYYCTNNSKTDYNVTGNHGRCWDESSRQAHYRNRPRPDQPFFAVFNYTGTHESRVFGYERPETLSDDELHDPSRMTPPPFHPDTPRVRLDWAHYYDNITAMDKWAGQMLAELESAGLADNTIVIYWSDHGAGLPRSKRWIYESGTHVPLIVRIPDQYRTAGQAEPGSVAEELVSLMDLGPTIMHLAGLELPAHFHGQPFLGPERAAPREYRYTIRDRMDERDDMMRGVRDARYKYIRNYQPYKPYFQIINYMEQEHTMQELRRLHAEDRLPDAAAQFMAATKPREELYDLQQDPHEINNLIDQVDERPELQAALERLRAKHREWIFATRDTGLIPEAELAARAERLGTRHAILQQPGWEDLLTRLLAVNELACAEQADESGLLKACQDSDAAVRFWALTGIGNHQLASDACLQAVDRALQDASGVVRVAAARAAWRQGRTEAALPVIRDAARAEAEFLALHAMHLIDDMHADAAPVWDVVPWVAKNRSGYQARVAEYLLKDRDLASDSQ